jgi:hypothetical protein
MINKNDTNEGINILPSQFVLLFNAETLRWEAEELKKDEDNIDINMIEFLLVTDSPLTVINKQKEFIEFTMPSDFFQVYGSYSYAKKGECPGKIYNYERKPGNLIPILQDEDNKPTFDYEEAPFIIGNDKLKLYIGDDYIVGETFINYYRQPKKIDMEGYINFDGQPSTNIDPELDDYNNLQILARLAVEINREVDNVEGFQLSKDRENSEF